VARNAPKRNESLFKAPHFKIVILPPIGFHKIFHVITPDFCENLSMGAPALSLAQAKLRGQAKVSLIGVWFFAGSSSLNQPQP